MADGAYAQRPFRKAARPAAVVVVRRLRQEAKLGSVPPPPRRGTPPQRGSKPTYAKEAIRLAQRAGHRRGWQTEALVRYRQKVTKTFQTFRATYQPAGGLIRGVLVRADDGGVAFFGTDPQAPGAQPFAWGVPRFCGSP